MRYVIPETSKFHLNHLNGANRNPTKRRVQVLFLVRSFTFQLTRVVLVNVVKFSRTISVPHSEVLITFEMSVLASGALQGHMYYRYHLVVCSRFR